MKETIQKHFAGIVGQQVAVTRLTNSVLSAHHGGRMLSPLIQAQAGNGKTALTHAYLGAMKDVEGMQTMSVTPDEIRTPETAEELFCFIRDSNKFTLHIDEAHLLTEQKNRTVWIDRIRNMLMKMMDGNNVGRLIEIADGVEPITFSPERGSVVLTTNYPERLDKSGALQSRFDRMELDLYNEDELTQILILMLEKKGFKNLNEKTLSLIARCGRGTARPIEKIVGELEIINTSSGKRQKTLNSEDVMEALVNQSLYPRGLKPAEIQILMMGTNTRLRDKVILAALPKLEVSALRSIRGYLYALGFIAETSSGIETTKRGVAYLDKVKEEKFPMPYTV